MSMRDESPSRMQHSSAICTFVIVDLCVCDKDFSEALSLLSPKQFAVCWPIVGGHEAPSQARQHLKAIKAKGSSQFQSK